MENISSSLEDLSLSVPSYAIVSDLLQRLGVDVGQLASIYFFLFAAYRVGQYLYIWLNDALLCVNFLYTRSAADIRQGLTLHHMSRLMIGIFYTNTCKVSVCCVTRT
jgi:hypothetical protein